jgi:micrococcal nuclease
MPIYGMDIDQKYLYDAELIRVVDGDTIDAWIDLGFNITVRRRICLRDTAAPETRTRDLEEKAEGFVVKNRLIEILELNRGAFMVRSVGVDKYGRCLGEIYVKDVNINKQLLAEGLVDVYGV